MFLNNGEKYFSYFRFWLFFVIRLSTVLETWHIAIISGLLNIFVFYLFCNFYYYSNSILRICPYLIIRSKFHDIRINYYRLSPVSVVSDLHNIRWKRFFRRNFFFPRARSACINYIIIICLFVSRAAAKKIVQGRGVLPA